MRNKLLLLILSFFMIGCSSNNEGLIDYLPTTINTFGNFFEAWVIILIVSLFLSIFLRKLAPIVLFIVIIFIRDYGFLLTALLFVTEALVFYGIGFLIRMFFFLKESDKM